MEINKNIPFALTDWLQIPTETQPGLTGFSVSRVCTLGSIRMRLVEFSAGYKADHWCEKGHIIYCVSGEMTIELKDGRTYQVTAGKSCQVGDGIDAHRLDSSQGGTLFIVD